MIWGIEICRIEELPDAIPSNARERTGPSSVSVAAVGRPALAAPPVSGSKLVCKTVVFGSRNQASPEVPAANVAEPADDKARVDKLNEATKLLAVPASWLCTRGPGAGPGWQSSVIERARRPKGTRRAAFAIDYHPFPRSRVPSARCTYPAAPE